MSRPSQFDLGIDHSGQVPSTTLWRRTISSSFHFALIALAAMLAGLFVFPFH
ncbi:hypothetical protein [Variovorax sp. OV329]|uniref:hypothetical protein n=1 Tax=Variovorax sp. OV329 TaxID=1882825 RepID=UPI0008E69AF0|nr:hypothetical protein [Variovorax sp. OV329]SFM99123.1 hypothetical protein SAMN05444747_112152 [Variovorax sp. OV329]